MERIERQGDAWRVFMPNAAGGEWAEFDGLILATPSYEVARLLAPVDEELGRDLGRIEHSGTAIVSLGFDRRQIAHPLDGMGVVVPAVEESPILACSFSSQKYPHRAPEGKVLLRVFVGGARRPELAEMPDEPLRGLVLDHTARLLGIEGEPIYCDVAHWPRTMPQYHVGHKELVSAIEARAGCPAPPGACRQRLSRHWHSRLHSRWRVGSPTAVGRSGGRRLVTTDDRSEPRGLSPRWGGIAGKRCLGAPPIRRDKPGGSLAWNKPGRLVRFLRAILASLAQMLGIPRQYCPANAALAHRLH